MPSIFYLILKPGILLTWCRTQGAIFPSTDLRISYLDLDIFPSTDLSISYLDSNIFPSTDLSISCFNTSQARNIQTSFFHHHTENDCSTNLPRSPYCPPQHCWTPHFFHLSFYVVTFWNLIMLSSLQFSFGTSISKEMFCAFWDLQDLDFNI